MIVNIKYVNIDPQEWDKLSNENKTELLNILKKIFF
jgi:hypothetical protein